MSLKSKTCTSKKTGKPLTEYGTESEAKLRANIIRKEDGISLRTYPCPGGNGWHLTKTKHAP